VKTSLEHKRESRFVRKVFRVNQAWKAASVCHNRPGLFPQGAVNTARIRLAPHDGGPDFTLRRVHPDSHRCVPDQAADRNSLGSRRHQKNCRRNRSRCQWLNRETAVIRQKLYQTARTTPYKGCSSARMVRSDPCSAFSAFVTSDSLGLSRPSQYRIIFVYRSSNSFSLEHAGPFFRSWHRAATGQARFTRQESGCYMSRA
jgi:hypothetical protein